MRTIAIFLAFGIAFSAMGGSVEDARVMFSTTGPDRYADGSVVLDGECYALVWSKNGNFDGFTAAGECIDAEDRIVLLAPVAKDGRCPRVLFQIPVAEANEMAGGVYAVYLLDTRVVSDGVVKMSGCPNGELQLMNGYGEASEGIAVAGASINSVTEKESAAGGQVASAMSPAAADCRQPKIKAIRIVGDNVFLTVENLGGFVRVNSGEKISASQNTTPAVEAPKNGEDVVLVARKQGESGFFKVIRNEN
jgi:hypothetical protein